MYTLNKKGIEQVSYDLTPLIKKVIKEMREEKERKNKEKQLGRAINE